MTAATDRSRRWLAPAAIVLLAAAVRVPGLDAVPPPLNQDEASRGYDAWCLLRTGADRWGARWPFFLRSLGPGDYTAALPAYLMLPTVAWIGPTPQAMRLPNALLGAATVGCVYAAARRLFGRHAALAAALFLAVEPWHLTMTRTAHEAALVPFFLALGLVGMTQARLPPLDHRAGADAPQDSPAATPRGRLAWAGVAGAALGAGAWAYPAGRLGIPLLILLAVASAPGDWMRCVRQRDARPVLLALAGGLLAGSAPVWLTLLRAPEQAAARAAVTVLFLSPMPFSKALEQTLLNWLAEFSPVTLAMQLDDICGTRFAGSGRLLYVEAVAAAIGIAVMARRLWRGPLFRFMLLWLLVYPLPAAICGGWNPHAMRAILGIPAWSLVAGLGTAAAASRCTTDKPIRAAIAVAVLAAATVVNAAFFGVLYFTRYADAVADDFQENLVHAMRYAAEHESEYDLIWVTPFANHAYLYALLYRPVPPEQFRAAPPVVAPWNNRFEHVVRCGKYLFAPFGPENSPAAQALQTEFARFPRGARGLAIEPPGHGPPGRAVHTLPRRTGGVGLELREFLIP